MSDGDRRDIWLVDTATGKQQPINWQAASDFNRFSFPVVACSIANSRIRPIRSTLQA